MTARRAGRLVASVLLLWATAACTSSHEVPIETPIQPRLDVSPFQRVFVAGFVTGGSDDVDANLETVRLLRSQLRTRSDLRVIDAQVLPLLERGHETRATSHPGGADRAANDDEIRIVPAAPNASSRTTSSGMIVNGDGGPKEPSQIRDEKELATYEPIFADVDYWKRIGEELQEPLIVTGTVYFVPYARSGPMVQERERFDQLGRRVVQPVRVYVERKGYILRPKFVFIDGRTGTVIYSESHREERLYMPQQNVPALSSYFEMMDAILPSFLNTLSEQRVRGVRILLK